MNGGVAVGDGAAWVGLQRVGPGPDEVMRVDLSTDEVVARIPVDSVPWRKRIAVTPDAVWVGSTGEVQRIDPSTNEVVAKIEVPGEGVSALAADESALWVLSDRQDGGVLLRIDPSSNRVVAEIPLSRQLTGYEDQVLIGNGAIWVLGVRWVAKEDAEYGSDLFRIDPDTNFWSAVSPGGSALRAWLQSASNSIKCDA